MNEAIEDAAVEAQKDVFGSVENIQEHKPPFAMHNTEKTHMLRAGNVLTLVARTRLYKKDLAIYLQNVYQLTATKINSVVMPEKRRTMRKGSLKRKKIYKYYVTLAKGQSVPDGDN